MARLDRKFFERDPVAVAQDLLGCVLVRKTGTGKIRAKIVETEAYGDATDFASHARFGVTKRNQIMYGEAGIFYVYHIYGIFYLTNIICREKGRPSAVLIRSAEIIDGIEIARQNIDRSKFAKVNELLATGPGKFSLALDITKEQNYLDIAKSGDMFIEKGGQNFDIIEKERVGIDYAGDCKKLPWRFYIKDNKFVSKK